MHRLFAVGLGCLVLASMARVVSADEAADFVKYYSWWEGGWNVETQQGDEATTSPMEITRHPGNCHLVAGANTGLWGYDPKRKKWVGTTYNSDGSVGVSVLDRHSGDKLGAGVVGHSTLTVKQADGTVSKGEQTWTYVDENTVRMVSKTTTPEGETVTREFKCRRVGQDGPKALQVSPD